ncbi:MAG: tetratricopeptide repeat protein [Gemmatimonadetes bacterium]|nr:tetratricopeptide repeat protein [Gemmatimonadota bacterium]
MNGNRPRMERKEPGLAKGVALAATGLVVALGVGALLIGDREPEGKQASPTRTNASRPAWAKERGAKSVADANRTVVAATATTTTAGTAESAATAGNTEPEVWVAETSSASEPIAPATWDEAQSAWDAGDWNSAADRFASYTEAHAGNPWGWFMAGLAQRQAGRPEDAEASLVRCLEIDPGHVKGLVALARVRLDLGHASEAVTPIEDAVARDPGNVDAQRVLARVLHTQGRAAEAELVYETALAIDPDDSWSNNNLGLLRIEGERFEEAVAPLQRACAVDAGQAVFFNNLGVALERTGRYRAAEEAYAQAVDLAPGDSKASLSLARVEQLGGPTDEPTGVYADAAGPEPTPGSEVSLEEFEEAETMALAGASVAGDPDGTDR